jgi:hypothetical protein
MILFKKPLLGDRGYHMDASLRCRVFPGQFSSELSIEGVQADGERFSLFAPAKYVTSDEPVTRDRSVEGWLRVSVWEDQGEMVLVRLPCESFESGLFVTILARQLLLERQGFGG